MKCNAETMTEYLDAYAKSGTRAGAARAVRIDANTAYRWLQGSKRASETPDAPSPYWFEYRGVEGWLHEHKRFVEKAGVSAIIDGILDRAQHGVTTVSLFQGRPVFLENPAFDELDLPEYARKLGDRDLKMLGFPTRMLRDEDGNRIPATVWTAPSTEISLAVAAAYSKRFSKRATIEHNHNHQGGVAVQHSLASAPRKVLEQRSDLPMMLQVVEPVAEQIADMSGLMEPGSEEQIAEPVQDQQAAPMEPVAPPPRVISPLVRDLMDRARRKDIL
jgi:hypothetical protein